MKRQHMPMLAVALVVAIVGALAVGVPFSTVALALLVLCCPLMMLFMHGDHGGHSAGSEPPDGTVKVHEEHRPDRRSPSAQADRPNFSGSSSYSTAKVRRPRAL